MRKYKEIQSNVSKFLIQIDNRIIRNRFSDGRKIDHVTFFLYCKLMQHYRYYGGTKKILEFDHKDLQYLCKIPSNDRLKKSLNCLFEYNLIKTKVNELPRNKPLQIEMNTYFDKKKFQEENKQLVESGKEPKKWNDFYYTQLPNELLDRKFLNVIGHIGVRLMYYYKSYVGKITAQKQYAFPDFLLIRKELGLANDTIDKYNKILKKQKLITIKNSGKKSYEEFDEFGNSITRSKKFNNNYYIEVENIVPLLRKLREKK